MHKILCLNKISPIGTDRLGANYEFSTEMQDPEGILVRSAAMHDMELPENLLAIARAGAGVNNIPIPKCSEKGIVLPEKGEFCGGGWTFWHRKKHTAEAAAGCNRAPVRAVVSGMSGWKCAAG